MLTGFIRRFNRPAAIPRRRSFLFGSLALTIGASLALGAWDGGDTGNSPSVHAARRSSLRAIQVLRPQAPDSARLLDRLIADAEVVTADERTAPSWERNPGRVEAAWNRVLVTAHGALSEQKERSRDFESQWLSLVERVGADVRRAQLEADEAGVTRREISAAKQAALKWDLAQRYAAAGAFDRALNEARQVGVFNAVVREGFVALHERYGDRRQLDKWRALVRDSIQTSRAQGTTLFVVDKLKRRLHVYQSGVRTATFRAELGVKGLKQKLHSGDQATPEGRYRVSRLRGPGRTQYYKALLIDYPNAADRARYALGVRSGAVPRRAGIGSLIEIHGDGGQGRDWTDGCIALANEDMDRVFALASVGTQVTIVGTF